MTGPQLLQLLMDTRGLNPNALAEALKGATGQPQISKYVKNQIQEPRRKTLQPIADYFRVPIDAFYDPDLADKTARELGILADDDSEFLEPPALHRVAEPPVAYAIPRHSSYTTRDALRQLRDLLAGESPGVRQSVVALMGDMATRADDRQFSDQIIERIMGALGQLGNDAPQPSIASTPVGGAAK
ncbi:helix-turn-helix domain-containing protein [Paracidovorax wautersii]|uniref:HTH cro/C1-type domain-containing protein n=1 Tax=Paracidovorax wautersii TaxID=1177982 RepID=A0A1I2GB90_9BURK|nr:helix-turn-helix transcriptional regulator [Paracidovorax wautersii]SFF15024.1 hypothetical protein SAMN04489711_11482 [Paracidovorax wautersii]